MPNARISLIAKQSALLAAIEVGLGSFLHVLGIPFRGHFLSLNQIAILCQSVIRGRGLEKSRVLPVPISSIAALLKVLSPAGKKLTPMLAIACQGWCFALGTTLAGTGSLGLYLGAFLSGLWAFVQPVLLYYLFFGNVLVRTVTYYSREIGRAFHLDPSSLWWVVGGIVTIKMALSLLVAFAVQSLPASRLDKIQESLLARASSTKLPSSAVKRGFWSNCLGALRDLFNPLFILSLLLTFIFLYYSENGRGEIVWILLRPIAVGWLLFLAVRIFPFEKRFRSSESLQLALQSLRKMTKQHDESI